MELKLLKGNILSNSVPNFLIFNVEEPTLAKQYIESISNSINKPYKYYSSAESVVYDIDTNIKEDYLYIIFNVQDISDAVVNRLINSGRNIIITLNNVDKRTSFYKQYSRYIVDFNRIDLHSLVAYVNKVLKNKKITVHQDKVITLVEHCNCDLGAVLNELDKIIVLGQDNSNVLMDYMMDNGFSDYRNVDIFKFINKILARDKSAVKDLHKIEDSSMVIVYNLYNKSRERFLESRSAYHVQIMKVCTEIYNRILDGTMSDTYALRYLLLEVLYR